MKLANSRWILSILINAFVKNIYIHRTIKKIYFKKFGNLFCTKLNQKRYTKTIIARAKGILNNAQLKLNHKTINIGEINKYIKELKLVFKKK